MRPPYLERAATFKEEMSSTTKLEMKVDQKQQEVNEVKKAMKAKVRPMYSDWIIVLKQVSINQADTIFIKKRHYKYSKNKHTGFLFHHLRKNQSLESYNQFEHYNGFQLFCLKFGFLRVLYREESVDVMNKKVNIHV